MSVDTSSIDSLLDATLDDLADIPEFKPFPKGAHKCVIKWDMKEINGKPAIELGLTHVETMELDDSTAIPPAVGDTTSVMYQLYKKDGTANEIAQGQFKEVMKPLAAQFGTTSNRETMAASNGAEVVVITGIRTDKKTDPQNPRHYTSVESLGFL